MGPGVTGSPKYLVAVNLSLLALTAYAASSVVNTAIAARLLPPPSVELPPPPVPAAPQPPRLLPDYERIYNPGIFNAVPPEQPVAAAPPPESPLPVKLLGVAVHDDPAASYCILEDQKTHKQAIYRTGRPVEGADAEVKSIGWDRVILLRGGREEVLTMSSAQPTPATAAPADLDMQTEEPPMSAQHRRRVRNR